MIRTTLLVAVLCWAGSPVLSAQEPPRNPGRWFPLTHGTGYPTAAGSVTLARAWSPFGMTVSTDGHPVYDAVLTVSGLPSPPAGAQYVAWLATPLLDRVERLGTVMNATPLVRRVDWNQLLVVVTLEPPGAGDRRTGPTVLVGRSRSALIRPLWGHSIFQRTPF